MGSLNDEIIIDLGSVQSVGSFSYQKRPGYHQSAWGINGTMGEYALFVSTDGSEWIPAGTGAFTREEYGLHEIVLDAPQTSDGITHPAGTTLYNVGNLVYGNFDQIYETRYVKIVPKSDVLGGTDEFHGAEIHLYADQKIVPEIVEEDHDIRASELSMEDVRVEDNTLRVSFAPFALQGVNWDIDMVAAMEDGKHYMNTWLEIGADDPSAAAIDYIDLDHFVIPEDAQDVWSIPDESQISSMWIGKHELMLGQPIYADGLFFGSESTGTGTSVTQAVADLNEEYQAHIQEIEAATPHDRQEITSNDGVLSVNWEDVLAVFSAKVTGAEDGSQVASLDDAQVDELRSIMWEMNAISYTTRTESSSVEVTSTDENGNEVTTTETVTETILEITITHKTPEEMAQQYSFNDRQNEYLALMTEPENENLWAELLGGYVSGGGQIIDPNTNWEGTGIFQWPLPQSYTITSWFGYRADPFTGEIDYHSGTDIGAPGGTPILAAADGTVTIANGIDSWGGGYGYYIKVRHNDTYETLYAHCSSICVVAGQEVKQGEVIGYVGTTGNSTGNHLHFEVWQNGQRTDALSFFRAKG